MGMNLPNMSKYQPNVLFVNIYFTGVSASFNATCNNS